MRSGRGSHLALCCCLGALLASCGPADQRPEFITVASTTSTLNSGLFDHLLPRFTARTGIEVRVVAVGTGQALRLARAGDADVLLVHHRPSEERFVADGFGVARREVMYNDFVLVGPVADSAAVAAASSAPDALARIARAKAAFVSRGDDSGTHKKERALWGLAGIDPTRASGTWYREAGSGMGATLNTAAGMQAYTLSDRATWISFRNREGLTVLFQGDERLLNPYGVIAVDPARHPHVKADLARLFIDWLTGEAGQAAIAGFRVEGQQLFFPDAAGGS